MINRIFQLCVDFLVWLAHLMGTSYEEINVWIFCVIWPVITVVLVILVLWQWLRIRRLEQKLDKAVGTPR